MRNIITVAIQGEKASFHEIAAHAFYKQPIELVYCRSFPEVFELLSRGVVDRGFVAVSNSNHGDIDEVKLLMENNDSNIEGEYLLPIQQHVIGLPNTDLEKVRTVISHPVAFSQSSIYIEDYFKSAVVLDYHDTSAAVEYVKTQNDPSIVAIGSERAAELHGLTVLRHAIQNDADNATLFQSLIKS